MSESFVKETAGVVVAGAGQAAAQLAQSLRQGGYGGPVTLVGDEGFLPYERPPLSKDYLGNKRDAAQLLLRRPEFWAERQVTLRLGQAIVAVNREASNVTLADGAILSYEWLVWATGGRPRRLPCPGADLAGVHTIRTIADIDALKRDLAQPRRVVVIGGGYIGLEAAAVLRSMGLPVTVLEAQERLLARVTSPVVSQFFLDLHRREGVDVRLGAAVRRLTGTERVVGVELASGEILPADLVVMGVGIIPNVEVLATAGLSCPNGVEVDAHCRTNDPRILAIGDCALHPSAHAAVPLRLESVQNAIDQAKTAAATILGVPQPYTALPWFWSDQYAVKMQTAGLCLGYDQAVVRGDASRPPFSVAYLRDGRLIAVDCLSAPKDFMAGKTLIAGQALMDPERLADPGVDLKAARISTE
ncbi:NAD(P)/FAD-dependent oxidoreductase [Nitrospirillum viridazoti]|uniref:Pyridine nucleotide-disulfide oxidoreductase n=1 Tax=Nitrospirillum viridazoti CBAmc TaxID=1441467 RepID=A0A248JVW3_9PROT|nr:FAD-dependent oxidoreductase [Nitrospirillum amazonense]ASG22258.1 pyridine nucleotide-disulfide oxidoreductase [Nitrospirillum amazonense CBAmc]TWB30976.1 NAD/ferredoxin-dependent reductase-like protein [Nitrospirillum amazonense]